MSGEVQRRGYTRRLDDRFPLWLLALILLSIGAGGLSLATEQYALAETIRAQASTAVGRCAIVQQLLQPAVLVALSSGTVAVIGAGASAFAVVARALRGGSAGGPSLPAMVPAPPPALPLPPVGDPHGHP